MIIRCRSKTGTARYELQPGDDVSALTVKILADAPEADPSSVTLSNQPRGGESLVSSLSGSLTNLGIKHGDLLFVSYKDNASTTEASTSVAGSASANGAPGSSSIHPQATSDLATKAGKKPWELVTEEPVDTYWEAQDGKIARSRDSRMCRHGDKSMCDHCMPLEPYDAKYQAENSIKHLSFHSYLRKLDIGKNKTTASSANTFIPPLEEPNYKVAVPCPSGSHPSWPAGICTKCQPSAVTLALQQYRMVDHVEFVSPALVEQVLQVWRKTGSQRFGWLLGRYEAYDQVPMGVKAVVEAIHEPPQEGDVDGIRLGLPWEDEGKIESLAEMCGLKVVGMLFTDLTPDTDPEAAKMAKTVCKRHKDSFFLSSLEAIFGAKEQIKRPNSSRFSASGRFSSKFVTCVITADQQGDIAVEAYQISDQAMAMIDADMIEASVEPGVTRIKEDTSGEADPSKKRYIPDVFYTYKNQYNLQVKESAKPCFPTDYMLVSLTNGFPKAPHPLFSAPEASAFPVENRPGLHDQTASKVYSRVNALAKKLPLESLTASASDKGKGRAVGAEALSDVRKWASDWHLLAYLDTMGIFDKSEMKLLANVATRRDDESVQALLNATGWKNLTTIASEMDTASNGAASMGGAEDVPIFEYDADGFPIIPEDHDMMKTDARPTSAQPASGSMTEPIDVDGIPAHLLNETQAGPPDAFSESAGGGGMLVCPHCTFENPPGTVDCEICSLPLSG